MLTVPARKSDGNAKCVTQISEVEPQADDQMGASGSSLNLFVRFQRNRCRKSSSTCYPPDC